MSIVAPLSPDKPAKAPLPDDDALPGLPPMDGGLEDADEEAAPALDADEVPRDDGGDPFDDATGEGDVVPELAGLDGEDGRSLLDAGEADGLDIGAHDVLGDESDRLTDDGKEEERPHDDYDLDDERAATALDAGEEGPEGEDDALRDDGLPHLGDPDDDDDAQDEASSFFEGDLGGGPGRGARSEDAREEAWSSPWERFGSPLSLPPTRALACAPDGVLTAGRELCRVDLEGATERLAARGLRGGEATSLLVAGRELFVTTETGGLFVSRDGGATFGELPAWRELVRPEEAAAGLDVVVSVDGALWGRTAQGSLLASTDRAERWTKVDVDGFVRAVAVDDAGRPVVLVRTLGASEVLRWTTDAAWSRTALPGDLSALALDGHASVVAHGRSVAIAIDGEGVLRSQEGGLWSHVGGTASVTAMAMLDAAGTLVVALPGHAARGDADAQSSALRLARVGADGEPKVVAVWGEREAAAREGSDPGDGETQDAGVTAIAVDRAHEVVWVAGGFGVAAFQPRMRTPV